MQTLILDIMRYMKWILLKLFIRRIEILIGSYIQDKYGQQKYSS